MEGEGCFVKAQGLEQKKTAGAPAVWSEAFLCGMIKKHPLVDMNDYIFLRGAISGLHDALYAYGVACRGIQGKAL